MTKPIAVLSSDVHYDLPNLELADKAMRMAINTANDLNVPLVVTGDLHDTKAALRGECVNRMLETFAKCKRTPYVLIGNHDRINEKSPEHSLNFLRTWAKIIDAPQPTLLGYFIPYCSDKDEFINLVKAAPKGVRLIVHQGIVGADMGEYIQDKSAVPKEVFASRRVISGHYHARQDIVCPDGGLFSYVGNPYTRSFSEANDLEKGYQILYDDGSLGFVPTKLRKHIVYEMTLGELNPPIFRAKDGDLVWMKIHGTNEQLRKLRDAGTIPANYRVDFILTDVAFEGHPMDNITQSKLLDMLIDSQDSSPEQKQRLKQLWRQVASN